MKNEKRIQTVEMTRQIRDRMYEETRQMSDAELLRYIQERSRTVHERIGGTPSESTAQDRMATTPKA